MHIRSIIVAAVLLVATTMRLGADPAADLISPPPVRINEFLADNDTVIADEYGEPDDVLELYNAGATSIDLGGMYLTDDLDDPTKFRISDTITLPPGGLVLFWADGSPQQGVFHTNFALSKSGESIGLFDSDANGNVVVDSYSFGAQVTDVSEGRCPDGGQSWLFYAAPTMGATNEPCGAPPVIADTQQEPAFPQAGEAVTVTATITDDGIDITATVWYSAGTGYVAVAMDGLDGDRYGAVLPGQPQDSWVQYYVQAEDDAGWTSTDPPGAPQVTYSYVSGYEPPPLALNELMADNQTTLEDPDEPGEYPDWFELTNMGTTDVDLGGLYLTDYVGDPVQFRIPDGVSIPAGGFIVFYADGEPEQGPLHTSFKLSADGEMLGLVGAGGRVRIDEVRFPGLEADTGFARLPDGTGDWRVSGCATPGLPNRGCHRMFLPLVLRTGGPAPLPLRLDCGSDLPYTAVDGTVYLGDHAWSVGSYGYVGGYQYLPTQWFDGNSVGGTGDHELYKTQRIGWEEYRIGEIPNGHYLLTLRFEEQLLHGPGFSVFDVAVEGQPVLDDFDLWAQVGRYYALNRRLAVTVADGELNIVAVPVIGEVRLSALELVAREPDSDAPAVPTGLAATSSYGAILLDWANNGEDDGAGYHVYRAEQPEGPYNWLTAGEPAYISRYQDDVAVTHVPYYYRVNAVDVYGNESAQSSYTSAAAIDWADATLPLYQLEVSPEDLAILYADPLSDNRVPGTFAFAGDVLTVSVRFRGSGARYSPKKSWKVVFPGDSPFPNQDRINVNGYWLDGSMVHSELATAGHEAAGIRPPETEHVLLALNGEYMGVYTRVEQADEAFLARTGRNPGASIYKVLNRFAQILPDEAAYRRFYEKETNEDLGYEDLISFIELINYTPDDSFAAAIAGVMNVEDFLDQYAVIVLTADIDSARHNIYLIHDLETGRWELVPWDQEITFGDVAAPIDMGTNEHPVDPGGGNMLRTRVLRVPEFRAYYCQRLEEYMDTIFSDAVLHPQVDAVYGAIAQDGLRDWRKPEWEENSYFTAAPTFIKAFITQRKQFLQGEMVTYCPGD